MTEATFIITSCPINSKLILQRGMDGDFAVLRWQVQSHTHRSLWTEWTRAQAEKLVSMLQLEDVQIEEVK